MGAGKKISDFGQRTRGVMRQERRDLERYPTIPSICAVVDRPEQIRCPSNVFQSKVKEQVLAGFSLRRYSANRDVIRAAVLYGVIENRRIGGQAGYGQVTNVTFERAVVEKGAGDVIKPEALADPVEQLCRIHSFALEFSQPLGESK